MRHRDLVWRRVGVVAFVVALAIGFADRVDDGLKLLGFGVALIGLVLIVQGKRVAAALRVERGRHRLLAQAIDARRRRRAGRGNP